MEARPRISLSYQGRDLPCGLHEQEIIDHTWKEWLFLALRRRANQSFPQGQRPYRGWHRDRPGAGSNPEGCLLILSLNAETDTDSDPDSENSSRLTAKLRVTDSPPKRQGFSGSHGQSPWF